MSEEIKQRTNNNTNTNVNKNVNKNSGRKSAKKKVQLDEAVRKGFKHTSGFMFSLLINIIIVFVVIRLFSYSFNFAYSVFGDVAKDYSGREYVVIEIPADSSTLQIGKALEDSGIIEDKYVFFAKVRIKKLGGSIKSGKYGLSSSMTYNEIINLICGIEEDEEE
ncbi:MAG: endolytic transglycosylase MltG [Lachnospiraceae bacterium]|nr:endolytic transglycosylase MltG [Lachnospiraceae bacterium]